MEEEKVYPRSVPEDFPFPPNLIFLSCTPTQPFHHSLFYSSSNSLFVGVHVQVYRFPGSFLTVHSAEKACSLPHGCDTIEP